MKELNVLIPPPFSAGEAELAQGWLGEKRPDFIIIGAMKCGTSSLHHMLEQHPDVYIPSGEVKFFTLDDYEQQRHHFRWCRGQWTRPDFYNQLEEKIAWYREHFSPAVSGQVIGEDSPTYLPSACAPARIASLLPSAKLIVVLRDPVERAYSQYWHQVRNGSATCSFDDCIRFRPDTILQRGYYLKQLQRYLAAFPANQLHVILFEEMIQEPEQIMADLYQFLGLSSDASPLGLHRNPGRFPRFPRLALWKNRKCLDLFGRSYVQSMPGMPEPEAIGVGRMLLMKLHGRLNPMRPQSPPAMREETRAFLNDFYFRENRGLDTLLNMDLAGWWPSWQAAAESQTISNTEPL